MKLQDIQVSKCTSHVHVPFAASWSEDNIVAMATDMGIYLMEITPSPFSKSATLGIRRYVVFPSSVNPTQDNGIDVGDLMRVLPEEDLYSVVQNVTLAPVIKGSRHTPSVKYAAWSPISITHNMRSMLTVLTDSGSLDLYCLMCNSWKNTLSISQKWLNICKSEWESIPQEHDFPKSDLLKLLHQRTYKIKITAFAWGEVHTGSLHWCPLFAATLDGTLLLWKVYQESNTIRAQLIGLAETSLGPITALNSHLVADGTQYLLFAAALSGRIQTHVVCLLEKSDSAAFIDQTYETWPEEDRIEMPGGALVSATWSNRVILAAAKGPHLLIILHTTQGSVLTNCVVNSNNLAITGISFISENALLMTTTEGSIYTVAVQFDYNCFLQTHFSMIQSTIQCENYRCNGFALSKSRAILCLAFSVQGNYDHLQLREYSQAVWSTLTEMDQALTTIKGHHGSLCHIWDIFELLRIQFLKKNWTDKIFTMPTVEELDVMDVLELKKNLWFIEIASKLDSNSKQSLESLREEIATLIMSSHVFKRVTQLTSTPATEINFIDQESLRVMRQWLYYLVNQGLKTSYAATHATASTLLQQIDDTTGKDAANSVKELCTICGDSVDSVENISTSMCVQGHSVPRCFLSMIQCGVLPYYTCPVCKVVAHPSAVTNSSRNCIFCDSLLRLDEKITSEDHIYFK